MRILALPGTLGLLVSLTACGANYNSIHRSYQLTGGRSLTFVDAKQRAVVEKNDKICTEPPPDVFSVYAQSLAASGSVSKGTDPTSLGVSGSFGASSSEVGSTISRTQAYNLMSLQAYYNCLSSLNGDAGQLDAPIDRVRLQRLIVSTIAIEQLTGSIRPNVVVIGAGGSATAGGSAEAMATLAKARQEDQTAKTNLKTAEDAKKKLEDEDPKCSVLAAKIKAGTAFTGDEPAKSENCTKADAAVAAMKEKWDDTDAYYKAQLASSGSGMSATVDTKQIEAKVIEVASQRDPATVQKVADTVKAIVMSNVRDQDETKFFCMRLLYDEKIREAAQRAAPDGAYDLAKGCAFMLLADAKAGMDAETRRAYDTQFTAAAQQIAGAAKSSFDQYWMSVLDANGQLDTKLVAQRLDPQIAKAGISASTARRLNALKTAVSVDEARAAFNLLPPDFQAALAK